MIQQDTLSANVLCPASEIYIFFKKHYKTLNSKKKMLYEVKAIMFSISQSVLSYFVGLQPMLMLAHILLNCCDADIYQKVLAPNITYLLSLYLLSVGLVWLCCLATFGKGSVLTYLSDVNSYGYLCFYVKACYLL